MTHDPRIPTFEEVMNGSPFDIVDSPWGHIERWRASTLATGTMGALKNVYDIVRDDTAAATARADAEQARVALLKDVHKKLDELSARCDAQASELAVFKAEARKRADEAAEEEEERRRALEEDPLEDPPDIAEYQARNPPSEIGDDQGILPNELQEGVPPAPSNHPNSELPKPPVVSQPISVSLNKE